MTTTNNTTASSTATPSLFVVPNPAAPLSSFFNPEHTRSRIEAAGFDCGEDEVLVEVWATSDRSSNWSCHAFDKSRSNGYWTSYLPLSALEDIKEGDFLEAIDPTGETVMLRASQLNFRYRRAGTFEQALQLVTKHLS